MAHGPARGFPGLTLLWRALWAAEAKGSLGQGSQVALPPHRAPLPQVFLTSPTEVAKVRLQTQTQAQRRRRPSASGPLVPLAAPPPCPVPPAGPLPGPRYRGPLHCLATVAREEGLRGLYKGSSALLFRDGHSFATYFLSYATLCEWLTPAGQSRPGEQGGLGPGMVQVRVCRGVVSPAGIAAWRGDGSRPRWPRGPQVGCSWPPTRVRTGLLRVAVDRSHGWQEPRAPSRPGGPASGACPTLPSLPGAASNRGARALSPQMSRACWWPVAVPGRWPGPWPPPWT